jgi:hypothetical protein
MLTFKIKSNDEVTLKWNLEKYSKRIQGRLKYEKSHLSPDHCTDPQYIANWFDILLFRGKAVTVIFTNLKYRFDNDERCMGSWSYITVIDTFGNEAEFPIEFIDKSYCLKRNHRRINLYNKTLIVGE